MSFTKIYKDITDIDTFLNELLSSYADDTSTEKSKLKGSLLNVPNYYTEVSVDNTQHTSYILVPGYSKQQLNIVPKGNYISVSSKSDTFDKQLPYLKPFNLSLYISSNIWDYSTADASLENGILKLQLQAKVKTQSPTATIEIK